MKLTIELKTGKTVEVAVDYLKIEGGYLFIHTPLQTQQSTKLSSIKKWEVKK